MKKTAKGIILLILILALSLTTLMPAYAVGGVSKTETRATALKQLRLFKGVSASSFELDRAPTRTEAMVMLIRTLGEESKVLNGSYKHPFTDVAPWADKYVGYAYEAGLTKGVSATEFGTGNAGSDMYLTFVLRALGYNDSAGDFTWNEPDKLAASVGILPSGVNTSNFLRADVALVSWAALEAKLKDGSQSLSKKLMDMKVFSAEEYEAAKLFVKNDGGTLVSTFAGLQAAAGNKENTVIQIISDIDISSELFIDREDGPATVLYIKEGVTVTVSNKFTPVGLSITNDGAVVIKGTFDRGLGCFTNNGSVTIKNNGTFCSGVTKTYNYGAVIADAGGNLLIERGTQFLNPGTITNNGHVSIKDGGSLTDENGSITNNGTIDLDSYFNGDITKIRGKGKLNDTRK